LCELPRFNIVAQGQRRSRATLGLGIKLLGNRKAVPHRSPGSAA